MTLGIACRIWKFKRRSSIMTILSHDTVPLSYKLKKKVPTVMHCFYRNWILKALYWGRQTESGLQVMILDLSPFSTIKYNRSWFDLVVCNITKISFKCNEKVLVVLYGVFRQNGTTNFELSWIVFCLSF